MKRCLNVLLIAMAIPWLLRADGGVFDAIRRGDTTALGKRLTAGADPNATDEYGATIVLPYPFCRQSRYSLPRRLAIDRSTVIVGTFAATAALIEQAKSTACSCV